MNEIINAAIDRAEDRVKMYPTLTAWVICNGETALVSFSERATKKRTADGWRIVTTRKGRKAAG